MAEAEDISDQWKEPDESAELTQREKELMEICRSEIPDKTELTVSLKLDTERKCL